MKLTLPVDLSELKKANASLFMVVIIDSQGHATSADGFVTAEQLALPPTLFTEQIGYPAIEAALMDYHGSEKHAPLVLTH